MSAQRPAAKRIKDVFYETRAAMGRGHSLRRFAHEVLGGTVEPITLGCIEKGTRFPTEALVRRLAAVRKEDPHPLLAMLWRDRMLYVFGRELRRVMNAPRGLGGIEDADLAVLVSHAIAALPPDDEWMSLAAWRKSVRAVPQRPGQTTRASADQLGRVEAMLRARKMIEVRAGKVRAARAHFVAEGDDERWSLSIEFCALFVKSLLDKLALHDVETGTYLRNHYLHVEPDKLSAFQTQLDAAVTDLVDRFAADASPRNPFLNVLIASTVP
ncbi:MAG: hypothetical protein U0531_22345 [Dehalococcoidia bacterium]